MSRLYATHKPCGIFDEIGVPSDFTISEAQAVIDSMWPVHSKNEIHAHLTSKAAISRGLLTPEQAGAFVNYMLDIPFESSVPNHVDDLPDAMSRIPWHTECPRCEGKGEETLFTGVVTCEVCDGAKQISMEAAARERNRAENERAKYR